MIAASDSCKRQNVDQVLRHLHRKLSKSKRDTPESAHIMCLIGPLKHLYVLKPINAIHEERLRDLRDAAIEANAKRVAADTTQVRGNAVILPQVKGE